MDIQRFICEADEYIVSKRAAYERDLGALIEIESVGTDADGRFVFGKGSAAAIDKMLEIGKSYGFKAENHDYYCASLVYGDCEDEVGMIAHLDVVPAGDGWSYPPYKLTVENGLLIGRGTEDDKGPAVAALYAMRLLKDKGITLPFSVRLLLGGDEERGMNDLPYYLKSHKPPFFSFTPDSEFPVCCGEKGIGKINVRFDKGLGRIASISGGTVTNAVAGKAFAVINDIDDSSLPCAEGISVSYEDGRAVVTAVGKTAHAATPEEGLNAIALLARYLLDNVQLEEDERATLLFLAEHCGDYLGTKLGIAEADELMGYLTCVGGLLKTEDGKAIQNFNVRYPRSGSWDGIIAAVEKAVAPFGGKIISHTHSDGYSFSPEKAEIQALTGAYELVVGEKGAPYTMGGGTYARSFPNTVAFGCTIKKHRGLLGEGRGAAHDRDEYLSVAEFESAVKIFALSLLKIAEAHK